MTDKNKLTSADLIITKFFGEESSEFYDKDYDTLYKYLKDNKIEDIQWFGLPENSEKSKKAFDRFLSLLSVASEKNRKSNAAFIKLKALVASRPSIMEIIESTEKGVQDVLKSVKNDVLDVLNYLSTPNGLVYIPAASATKGHQELSDSFKDKVKKEVTFKLIAGDDEYDCAMKQVEDYIVITIKCDDASKEFFITGNGYAESGKPVNGMVEFTVAEQCDYIISVDGEYFRAISLN